MQKYNIMTPSRHGVLKRKYTNAETHEFNQHIQNSFGGKLKVAGNFVDLAKVFDVLDQHILLKKLECYSIR